MARGEAELSVAYVWCKTRTEKEKQRARTAGEALGNAPKLAVVLESEEGEVVSASITPSSEVFLAREKLFRGWNTSLLSVGLGARHIRERTHETHCFRSGVLVLGGDIHHHSVSIQVCLGNKEGRTDIL